MKKKHIFTYIIMLLLAFSAQAQIENENFIASNCLEVGSTNYVFATVANIRQEGHEDSQIVAKLPIGTRVKVVDLTNKVIIKGIETAWYQIEFGKQKKQGYILGTLLSVAWQKGRNGEIFLFGHSYFDPKIGLVMQARAVKDNQLLSFQDFIPLETIPQFYNKTAHDYETIGQDFPPLISVNILGNQGIDNIQNLVVMRYSLGYCSFANQDFLFFWNGERFLGQLNCCWGSDYPNTLSSQIIFPTNATEGIKSTIILKEEEREHIEDNKYKIIRSNLMQYHFVGNTLVKKTN